MRKTYIILGLVLLSMVSWSQKKGDFGLFGGVSYYLGEINHTYQFVDTKPAYGLFYRHNYNYRYSLRTSVYRGRLTGNDAVSPWDYNRERDHSFTLDIYDVSSMLEFNFLPYVATSPKHRFSPYVTAGLSYMISTNSDVPNTMSIPMGIGFKFSFAKRFSAGFEWVIRRSFSDEIDGLGEYENDPLDAIWLNDITAQDYRQKSLIYRNDLYTFTGFYISYKFAYNRFKCPAYGEANMYE